ncbi:hypothetical protein VSU19_04260 [Verrucomicrobiales bacterium BCK34]|nr:hypothetical protein [Verrucomicrobiales bacterium BCK34]
MNSQTSNLTESAQPAEVSAVLKLECPFCHGGLNLRRIHLGIEGECVHCHEPVTAIEDESGCRLVSAKGIPDSPFPGPLNPPAKHSLREQSPVVETQPLAPVMPESKPVAEALPQVAAEEVVQSAPPAQSPWGFPGKETEAVPPTQADPPPFAQLEKALESEDVSSFPSSSERASSPEFVEEAPFQSPSKETVLFGKLKADTAGTADAGGSAGAEAPHDSPPPLDAQAEAPSFSFPGALTHEKVEQAPNVPPVVEEPERTPFQSGEVPPALEIHEENTPDSPPPLEPVSEIPPPMEGAADTPGEAIESPPVIKSQPLPVGISPFSTGSAKRVEPGFAETLFTGSPAPEAPKPPALPHAQAPDMSAPDDVAFNAANQWGPPAAVKTSDGQELDFSAIPPPSQKKAEPAGRPVPAKMPKKRKSNSGAFKKIFKFFLTLGIIGGIAFGANTFVPEAKWGQWKQQVIDWLEPGSVILEKLPFGKNKQVSTHAPPAKPKSATRTRQEISEELLRIPVRTPMR